MSLERLRWMEILETGLAEIDDDHRQLVEDFNAIVDVLRSGNRRSEVIDRLEEMLVKLRRHFAIEEEVLRRRRFPRLEAHIQQHQRLEAELEHGVAMVRHSGSSFECEAFMEHVQATLIEVLVRHDLDYKSHILHTSSAHTPAVPG